MKNPLVLDRKRKNSVTEFLRYYCRTEFPVNGDTTTDIYSHVLNGDIKTAVRKLTKQKQHKLALIVAQSVNSRAGMDKLKSFAATMNLK